MKSYTYILLFFALLFTACQDVIELDLAQGPPQLVVEGWIDDQPVADTVYLKWTGAYFKNAPLERISGATVVVTEAQTGLIDTLKEVAKGKYITQKIVGKVGFDYKLDVKVDGEAYKAQSTLKRPMLLDSLKVEFVEKTAFSDAGYNVKAFAQEPLGRGDYFLFKRYINDTLLNKPLDRGFTNDLLADGNYINGAEIGNGRLFKKNDKVTFEILSITDDAYYFFLELQTQMLNGGLFSAPPANVRTNVYNLNDKSVRKGVGYFGACAKSSKTIICQ